MTESTLNRHLEAQEHALPAAVRSHSWRADALSSFKGLPTRREERWRYTDLSALDDDSFDFVPPKPDAEARARVAAMIDGLAIHPDGPRLVFVNGHYDAAMSRTTTLPGFTILSLADAWESFAPNPGGAGAGRSSHPLAALNTAFVQHGALVKVAADAASAAPIHCIFVTAGRNKAALQPRVVIELGEAAAATIVEHFVDAPEASGAWLNLVTEATLAPGSKLAVYRLQEHNLDQIHTSLLKVRLARDARLTAGYVDRGGKLVRNDVDVTLAEPGAHADLFGIVHASGEQHIDNTLLVEHAAPRTVSVESFRAIVDDRAHGVFCGKVIVRPDAQHIDARQSSDNLLLSSKAEIDTKPELEIYADDVKCSHGATVGELDEEHLFYLRSRGIAEDVARALLKFAFAQTVLERIELPALRERAVRKIAGTFEEDVDAEVLR